ncbi:MAG: flagellar basal body rod protein FlgB [Betaproteobacteria bacterium]|nr:flagellar basal body rod protein FlgB [Betaproteobacteria bacterium]
MSNWETTVKAVTLALDAASLKQQVIAANIANAGVEGYSRRDVSFASQIEAARQVLERDGVLDASLLEGMRPAVEVRTRPGGEALPVQLDQEMVAMAENAVRYQMLVKALTRQMNLLATAAGDGKR